MTPHDKELLFRDLSARLPYGVVCRFETNCHQTPFFDTDLQFCETQPNGTRFVGFTKGHRFNVSKVKPFLRPISSMTEDETNQYHSFFAMLPRDLITTDNTVKLFDWLNTHHFDYRGLIEKGLAIAVTESNNPYK